MADKMRVHILAKELNVTSKAIIEKCRAEGIDSVKNHMSTLSAGLHATIVEWFSEGSHDTSLETSERVDLGKVRVKRRRAGSSDEAGSGATDTATLDAPSDLNDEVVSGEIADVPEDDEIEVAAEAPVAVVEAPPVETSIVESPPVVVDKPIEREIVPELVAMPVEAAPPPPALAAEVAPPAEPPAAISPPKPVIPAGPQHVPAPAKLHGPRVIRYAPPEPDVGPFRRPAPPVSGGGFGPNFRGPLPESGAPPKELTPAEKAAAKRKGRVNPRRLAGRAAEAGERLAEWRDRDLLERKERLAGATGRRIHHRRSSPQTQTGKPQSAAPAPKSNVITLYEPVRVKEFCSATGVNFFQVVKVLKEEHNLVVNINMTVPTEIAQMLALHFGVEVEVIPAKTLLDELAEQFDDQERKELVPRPPVVTMLGHVDHGKTSLLDAIRKTRVTAGEDGGITQQIGSYHLQTARGPVTFLDTPGHEAFTAMRARGAKLTDVVVLVVAADDGVMPQTVEAINHAKSATVPIVVALNKIDLGDQNKLKIYGQLSEHGLAPSEWGGEVDVIPTSATSGGGVKELVEHLADLSSLLDLKADPTLPAQGTVIEAEMKPGVGAVVRVLVQDGTLRVGNIAVCGNAFGKIRALLDDRGNRVQEVGPGIPVEVWGLDEVPTAGDRLYEVENLQRAKDVAMEMRKYRIESARIQSTKVKTLEEMFKQRDSAEIPELNLVLKADFDGSVSALKQSLAEIPSDEVKLSIRHAGVGSVTDSDILLAATCRGIVVAFRVDTSVGARRLADQHGVDVRSYRVIYDVCDDIKKALEGLLAPDERVESRGVAEVRQIFNVSKVGVIAGSFVTQGTIERNHLAKVVRNGVVVREGCTFASVRRFKDDVREVRAGMECGLRLDGFSDLHAGDTIETYEIVKIARTL